MAKMLFKLEDYDSSGLRRLSVLEDTGWVMIARDSEIRGFFPMEFVGRTFEGGPSPETEKTETYYIKEN